jgi:hypothetical protein
VSFTPGPWRWIGDPRERVDAADGKPVLWPRNCRDLTEPECWGDLIGDYDRPEEEVEANARLIAAAPEMHELLRVTWLRGGEMTDDLKRQVFALLARIDGKETP